MRQAFVWRDLGLSHCTEFESHRHLRVSTPIDQV
jgi:hypothetical protein